MPHQNQTAMKNNQKSAKHVPLNPYLKEVTNIDYSEISYESLIKMAKGFQLLNTDVPSGLVSELRKRIKK